MAATLKQYYGKDRLLMLAVRPSFLFPLIFCAVAAIKKCGDGGHPPLRIARIK
jgi:hypothetical protein